MYKLILILLLFNLVFSEPFDGLTLITDKRYPPYASLLIDNNYNIINEWQLDCKPNSITYLMPDSSLILPCWSIIKRLDWNGNLIWEYFIPIEEYGNFQNHHDIEPLLNGNILVICWERKTAEEALAVGRQNINGTISPLVIIELKPIDFNSAEIVWEWHAWDHLIQDVDPSLPNFGIISENPQLIDINLVENLNGEYGDWLHTNSIHYSPRLNQIILSSRFLNEIFIVDHTTSTEEASNHTGGYSGKGGDLLYRWGNPANYDRGNESNQILSSQHSANWIPSNYPGEGNIILFNNEHTPNNSSVMEIIPPLDPSGIYILNEGEAYEPENYFWIFELDYLSNSQSGAFKLPNGNILFTTYSNNKVTEIDIAGEVLWEYDYDDYDDNGELQIARALKYSYDYFDGVYPCLSGDMNGDGGWNVLDIVALANCVLAESCGEPDPSGCAGDMNGDGGWNVLDIVALANCVLAESCGN